MMKRGQESWGLQVVPRKSMQLHKTYYEYIHVDKNVDSVPPIMCL